MLANSFLNSDINYLQFYFENLYILHFLQLQIYYLLFFNFQNIYIKMFTNYFQNYQGNNHWSFLLYLLFRKTFLFLFFINFDFEFNGNVIHFMVLMH